MARDVSVRERMVFVVGCPGTNAMGDVFEVGVTKSMTLRIISRGRDFLSWFAGMLCCCREEDVYLQKHAWSYKGQTV